MGSHEKDLNLSPCQASLCIRFCLFPFDRIVRAQNSPSAAAHGRVHRVIPGHLLFGMISSLLGVLIVSSIRRYSKKSSH